MRAPEPWFEALCSSLLNGESKDVAVDRAITAGGARERVEVAAAAVVASPLLTVAQRIWVQLVCREWMLAAVCSLAARERDFSAIDRLDGISQNRFVDDYYSRNRALFLSGIAQSWPAVTRWNAAYLKERCGSEFVEVMEGRTSAPVTDQTSADYLRRRLTFAEYIDLVSSKEEDNDIYLVARNRFFASDQTSQLLEDVGTLPFVNTRPDVSDVKLWFGPAGTYTPLHYDGRNNLLVQIIGSKKIRLYSPIYSRLMSQTVPWYAGRDPVHEGGSEESEPADAPAGITLRLGPGDALFIPVGWWHAVKAESVSISLNFHDFGLPNKFEFPVGRVAIGSQ